MSEAAQRALEGCQVSGGRIIRWLEDEDPRGAEARRSSTPILVPARLTSWG